MFSANLVVENNLPLADYFGTADGRDNDKMDVTVEWEKGAELAVPILCSSPISFELEVDKEIATGEHDEKVLLCRIRNTLKDESLVNSFMTSEELLKATAAVRTCIDYDYWSWDGRHLGKWHERAKEIKADVEIGASRRTSDLVQLRLSMYREFNERLRFDMKKVMVIGCPGSGKSTFSRKLHTITGIPLFHLDMMYWNADRTTVDKAVFLERLSDTMKMSEWIIDGNYGSTIELRLKECDTVIFLDYPLEVCMEGIKARRGKERTDMPWVEAEDDEDAEFIEFINNYSSKSRPQIMELLDKYSYKNIIVFKHRDEADEFLIQMER